MFFGKKLKAFSMVELMMVLLISALIIAAIVPIVTRKHMQLPTIAAHGAYLCYYGPKGIDAAGNITDPTVVLREARWTGTDYTRKVFDRETANCVFEPPKKAAFFQITAVGGGGGGSDSGYVGTLPTQKSTDYMEFNPFMITQDDLDGYNISYDTFKKYGGYVLAYSQAKASGKGGDMGWYKYTETTTPSACSKYYDKEKVTVHHDPVNVPIPHHEWVVTSEGTPGKAGYYTYNSKKFIREPGDAIMSNDYCCTYKGGHDPIPSWEDNDTSTSDKEASDCFSCYTGADECVDGEDKYVWAREVGEDPHFEDDGAADSRPLQGLDSSNCQICSDAPARTYWMVCDKNPAGPCSPYFQDDDPYPYEESGTKISYGPRSCVPGDSVSVDRGGVSVTCPGDSKLCTPRSSSDLEWRVNPVWVSEEEHDLYSLNADNCTYKLKKFKKRYVWKECYGGWIKPGERKCSKVADPDGICGTPTGEYEDVCYEYDETKPDGKGALMDECPSTDSSDWTWHAAVAGTPGTGYWNDWEEDNWVDVPDTYEWQCPEGKEDPTTTAHCACEVEIAAYKTITYKRTDSSRVTGYSGGSGAQCHTTAVKADAAANMLKYFDASNKTGEYLAAYPYNVTIPDEYFTADRDGTDGDNYDTGNHTVPNLGPGEGWDASYHPGTLQAARGKHWCALKASPYTQEERITACASNQNPTWSTAIIKRGGSTWTSKAFSASMGGTGGMRSEYNGSTDNDGNTIYDIDGNVLTVRLNSPDSSGSSGTDGTCGSGTSGSISYSLSDGVTRTMSQSQIFSTAGTKPYGYILIHDDNSAEDAGLYKTNKTYDTNQLAVGIPGSEGEASTVIVKSISSENRSITVGVGGSAAGLGTGGKGANGSSTSMGSLITVEGGLGGYGSSPTYYEYPSLKVYDAVEYATEDACYFKLYFDNHPTATSYMGRTKASVMSVPASACTPYQDGTLEYKWHLQDGGAFGSAPDFESTGGKPTFDVTATSPIAQLAFDNAGTGGQGGGVEHFCMASQRVVVFDGRIDYSTSIFRYDALYPDTDGQENYDIFFGGASPLFPAPTAAEKSMAVGKAIPRKCYRDTSLAAYNHIAASPGKDGVLLIRW